jgi:hypothetical protein
VSSSTGGYKREVEKMKEPPSPSPDPAEELLREFQS